MVLEPKEHYFLEVGLSSLEEPIQLVQLRKLDDLKDLAGVLDGIQHRQVVQIEVVHYLAECLILDLSIEVNNELFIFPCLLGDFIQENLLEIQGLRGHNCDMSCDLLGARQSWLIVPERLLLSIDLCVADRYAA